jgi:hypothetical protein
MLWRGEEMVDDEGIEEQRLMRIYSTEPQVIPHQAKACESTEAEQTHSPMDSIEDW